MSWQETFGVFGLDPEDVAKQLDVHSDNGSNYVPIKFSLGATNCLDPKILREANDVRVVYTNPFQREALKILEKKDYIGIVDGHQTSSEFEVYRRGSERSYEIRLPKPVTLPLSIGGTTVKTSVDMLTVKTWRKTRPLYPVIETKVLEEVNKSNYQNPNTIPLVAISTPTNIQLIKAREPRVTYNDLPQLIDDKSSVERQKIFEQLTAQVFQNWANLAAQDLFQLSMIPMDHRPKKIKWMYRCGGGDLREGLEGLANAGFLRVNGATKCIIRDMEHVRERKQILSAYKYNYKKGAVKKAYFTDKFSIALGSALVSTSLMVGKVGTSLDIGYSAVKESLINGLSYTYSELHGVDCPLRFEIPDNLIEYLRCYKSTSNTIPGGLINQFIDPFFIEYFIQSMLEKKHRIQLYKDEISENFLKASRKSVDDTLDVLDNLGNIRTGNRLVIPNRRLIPMIFREISSMAVESRDKAKGLINEISKRRIYTERDIKDAIDTVNTHY